MNVVINLNKPSGISSQQAVTRVKRLLEVKKAGHCGTLDPLASGVLLICLDEATKIARFLTGLDKEYKARIRLGQKTDTYDSEGIVIETKDISFLSRDHLVQTIAGFRGNIIQKPPMYSAVKVGGATLYKLARKGIEVERPDRSVKIYDLSVDNINMPFVDLSVVCSKGTYIRSLCNDIGELLGVGAHLVSLVRTASGPFHINNAVTFDDLLSGGQGFLSIDSVLDSLKVILLNNKDCQRAKNGVAVPRPPERELNDGEYVLLKDLSGKLFGIGIVKSDLIAIERIMNL